MNEKLQAKVDLIAENYVVVERSGMLSASQAASLGALILTAEDAKADEESIRACRKVLKSKADALSNFRGATNLATLCRMSLQDDPEAWLDDVMDAYEHIGSGVAKVFRQENMVFTAMGIAAMAEPADYAYIAEESWAVLERMSKAHPIITGYDDLGVISMMVMAGLDVDEALAEVDEIYKCLETTDFAFNKDALQTISVLMALSDKPVEEKCARFTALRDALKASGHKLDWVHLTVLAAFTDVDATVEEIAQQIAQVDDALKHRRGFGPFLCGEKLRRLYAASLVLQVYDQADAGIAAGQAGALSTIIAQQIAQAAVTTSVIVAVNLSLNS